MVWPTQTICPVPHFWREHHLIVIYYMVGLSSKFTETRLPLNRWIWLNMTTPKKIMIIYHPPLSKKSHPLGHTIAQPIKDI